MCGLFGIVDWKGDIKGFCTKTHFEAIECRGPDGRGMILEPWFIAGHSRLSIQDLSWRGHQPFQDASGRFVIVYNGEIYNFHNINDVLRSAGHVFRTASDTETLIEHFCRKGMDAFHDLQGMFSGAIFDRSERSVYLFRDRLGVKPLYYALFNSRLFLGSTPAVVADLIGQHQIDNSQHYNYLAFRSTSVDGSFFSGVKMLRPGVVLKFSEYTAEEHVFWDVRNYIGCHNHEINSEQAIEQLRYLISRSVEGRLVADVPVGAFLSGGLDSTIVVHHMAELSREPVYAHTFSSSFNGDDETDRARMTAKHYGAHCDVLRINYEEYLEDLVYLTNRKGAPLLVPNEYAIYKMARKMRSINTVVLSGEGADEVFWGYSNIFTAASEIGDLPGMYQKAQWIFDKYRYVSPSTLKIAGFNDSMVADYVEYGVQYIYSLLKEFPNRSLSESLQYFFLRHHLPGLLMRLDNATMAASIEGRAPFTDHSLVEFGLSLPPELKLGVGAGGTSGKQILYQAYQDIPDWVIRTPKIGFKIGDTLNGRSEFHPILQEAYSSNVSWFDSDQIPAMEKWHLTMLGIFTHSFQAGSMI